MGSFAHAIYFIAIKGSTSARHQKPLKLARVFLVKPFKVTALDWSLNNQFTEKSQVLFSAKNVLFMKSLKTLESPGYQI